MLDHQLARRFVGVADRVLAGLALLAREQHYALGNAQMTDRFLRARGFHGNVKCWVGRIGYKPPLIGMEGLDNTFPSERVTLENVEGPGVDGFAACVLEP